VTIDVVAIVTCDRPAQLLDCVAGYAANCRDHGRHPEFVIVDDSKSHAASENVQSELARLVREHDLALRYAGLSERHRFADIVASAAGLPVEIVRFGLLGDARCELSVGANRNALLLDTVGSCVFSPDDDTVCRLAPAPDCEERVTFIPSGDPTDFWFYPDQASATSAQAAGDADLLGLHESLLGHDIAPASQSAPTHVALTMNGLAGDCGMASPRYYLSLAGPSRERLVASEDAYRAAFTSRGIVRAVPQPTVCAESFVMTTFFGFDNRDSLPPFLPVGRNSDGVLGALLPRCLPSSRVALLPWTLHHLTAESRRFTPNDLWVGADQVRLSDIVIDCVLTHAVTTVQSAADGMARLGAHVRQIGALPLHAFDAYVRSVQGFRAAAFTTLLSQRLQTYRNTPAYWAADVQRVIERMERARLSDSLLVPLDLCAGHDEQAARRLSQDLVGMFGQLLEAWPTIVDAASRLRAAGVRLSRLLANTD